MIQNKFNVNANYKVKLAKSYNLDFVFFSTFYLPIIDIKAYTLYLFFYAESQNNFVNSFFQSSQRIVDFLNLSEKNIEKSLIYLEFLSLIEIYKVDNSDDYIYVLKKPLDIMNFDSSLKLKQLLISKIGEKNYDINFKNYFPKIYKHDESYKLLSTQYQFNESKIVIENAATKIDFLPLFNIFQENIIDYKKFWNKEIEETIKDLIILYKLSLLEVLNVFKYMIKEKIKINSKSLNEVIKERFNFKIVNLDKVIENEKISLSNKYKLFKNTNSLEFLNLILNRTPTNNEMKVIVNLEKKFGFNNHIINILLDYSNLVNGGFIIPNYIYKIAESLKKNNLDKEEEVISYLKTAYKLRKHSETTEEIDLNVINIRDIKELKFDKKEIQNFGEIKWTKE